MTKSKLSLLLHLVSQVIAQGAIVEFVPVDYKPLFMAIVAIIGVIIGFLDTTAAKQESLTGKKF